MKKYLTLTALALAFAVGGAWMITRPAPPGSLTDGLLPGAAQAQEATADTAAEPAIDISTINDMVLGSPDAPVTMIEYASFTCPHCRDFHADQWPQIKANYIDTGKVKFIFREVYFDRFGLWASMMARCGGDLRFFGITDIIYNTQEEWIAGGEPALIAENLKKIGLTSGMDEATVDACMRDEIMAKTLVAWYTENSARDEVTSTPTLFIDGVKYSNMPYDQIAPLLDAAIAD
ncbi:MAG: thioredoxin domain-containing protein [Rhodobacterales bacterium]|jgi:protein-disulfide isomerase|nr:thioredoxin domain-containing protein [Rhodobacterales bacterium]